MDFFDIFKDYTVIWANFEILLYLFFDIFPENAPLVVKMTEISTKTENFLRPHILAIRFREKNGKKI